MRFNTIRMITYWNGRRSYQYHIDCSTDGRQWRRLVDQSKNRKAATARGQVFTFEPVTARYVRSTFTHNSEKNESGGHIVEIEGYFIDESAPPEAPQGPMQGAVGSVDVRYDRDTPPRLEPRSEWSATAWRGERVHGQFVVWTGAAVKGLEPRTTDLDGPGRATIAAEHVVPRFVRYTMGAGKLLGDILEPAKPIDIAAGSTRPVWLSVNVPADAAPGVYTGKLTVAGARGRSVAFGIKLDVLPHVLPAPREWSFHLDL
ncbi:MAG: glycoside hydrolase domain-containing protein, partial [Planctomycetota bacterium]